MRRVLCLVGVVVFVFLSGCSEAGPPRKETFPVTGYVIVDGQPAGELRIELHDTKGMDTNMPTFSSAFTDKDGKFEISTYEQSDGVPEGEYAVTFLWGKMNYVSMSYGPPDKLKGKYSDPKTSPFKIKVEKGKPTDMGRVELSTK